MGKSVVHFDLDGRAGREVAETYADDVSTLLDESGVSRLLSVHCDSAEDDGVDLVLPQAVARGIHVFVDEETEFGVLAGFLTLDPNAPAVLARGYGDSLEEGLERRARSWARSQWVWLRIWIRS